MTNNPLILPNSFYLRDDVETIARELLGKTLVTSFDGGLKRAKIVETEAYCGRDDRACHAYNGLRTKRTETMYHEGGCAYVYLCYGIHHLFNVVTNVKDVADAVLIRGVEPLSDNFNNSNGPGKLTKALGITKNHDGLILDHNPIWIEHGADVSARDITAAKRIGVDYAGEDAKRLWRFYLEGNPWVSKVESKPY